MTSRVRFSRDASTFASTNTVCSAYHRHEVDLAEDPRYKCLEESDTEEGACDEN
jgi:hypothetical protein